MDGKGVDEIDEALGPGSDEVDELEELGSVLELVEFSEDTDEV